jgi:hypothetical protein
MVSTMGTMQPTTPSLADGAVMEAGKQGSDAAFTAALRYALQPRASCLHPCEAPVRPGRSLQAPAPLRSPRHVRARCFPRRVALLRLTSISAEGVRRRAAGRERRRSRERPASLLQPQQR